jgi:hypothetical protein
MIKVTKPGRQKLALVGVWGSDAPAVKLTAAFQTARLAALDAERHKLLDA